MEVSLRCNAGSLVNIMKLLNNEFSETLKRTDIFSLAKVKLSIVYIIMY